MKNAPTKFILAVVCSIGLLLSGYGFLMTGLTQDAVQSHRALDETLRVSLDVGAGSDADRTPIRAEVLTHLARTEVAMQAISKVTGDVRLAQAIAFVLWGAALALVALPSGRVQPRG